MATKRSTTTRKKTTKKTSSSKNWIQGAIKRPGAFTAKAKKAGMSTRAYAAKVLAKGSTADATTKRQARLMQTLGKMRGRKKKK